MRFAPPALAAGLCRAEPGRWQHAPLREAGHDGSSLLSPQQILVLGTVPNQHLPLGGCCESLGAAAVPPPTVFWWRWFGSELLRGAVRKPNAELSPELELLTERRWCW